MLRTQWWDSGEQRFYQVKDEDGELRHSDEIGHSLSLSYYRVLRDPDRLKVHLDGLHEAGLKGVNVESLSHYPVLFYQNGDSERGAYWLKELISPGLFRREYPEVSYGAIEAFVYEMADIRPDGPGAAIEIVPRLPEGITWFEIRNVPFLEGEFDVSWREGALSVKNRTGKPITVNGKKVEEQEV